MTMNRTSLLRSAVGALSVRWITQQIGLTLLVFVLGVAWLRIPDASAVDVVGTVLLGLLVLALAGGGETVLLLRLSRRPVAVSRVVIGGVAILLGIAVWLGWSALLEHVSANVSQWEGYLNSRFPHGLRNIFSYEHLYTWTLWLLSLLKWLGAGAVAAIVAGSAVSVHPARAVRATLRSLVYWIGFLVSVYVALTFTGWIADWTPGHGLTVESLSLILRMVALVVFDGVVVSFVLSLLVTCLTSYEMPAGTPDESQPLTVANP
jgi:hypothetical protein